MQEFRIATALLAIVASGCEFAQTGNPLQTQTSLRGSEWHACVMREYKIAKQASGNQTQSVDLAFRKCKTQETAFNRASHVAAEGPEVPFSFPSSE